MRHLIAGLGAALALAGCAVTAAPPALLPPAVAARNFVEVASVVEPVAEQVCRQQAPAGLSCDFVIVVDDRPGVPPNAFQFRGPDDRPVVGFTVPLIADARNVDELAFVLGHEAAHHIAGHRERQDLGARDGAIAGLTLARERGVTQAETEALVRIGAAIGAQRFGKTFELEADAIGAVIAARAGFDPAIGVRFFDRLPDPGDQFLGTHPPNAERIARVERIARRLGTGS